MCIRSIMFSLRIFFVHAKICLHFISVIFFYSFVCRLAHSLWISSPLMKWMVFFCRFHIRPELCMQSYLIAKLAAFVLPNGLFISKLRWFNVFAMVDIKFFLLPLCIEWNSRYKNVKAERVRYMDFLQWVDWHSKAFEPKFRWNWRPSLKRLHRIENEDISL